MAKVTRLNVMITASTKGLSFGINKAQGMLRDLNRTATGVKRDMGKAFTGIGSMAARGFTALGAAATAAAGGLAYLTKKSMDAVGDTNDFAKSLGLTYNQLRAIQFAAQQAGVDAGALNAAFAKMSDTLGTAFGGDKAAIQAFEKIGLSVAKLAQMSPAQQFEAIAQAINKIEDPSVKMAAARDIFGKSGGRLIALFENSGQAINQAAATLGLFGGQLTQLDVEKIDAASDSLFTMGMILEGVGTQLARVVSPWIQQVTTDTIAWVAEMGGVGPAVDAAVNVTLAKLDEILNKLDAINQKWNSFIGGAQGIIGKGFAAADEFGKKSTYGQAITAAEQEAELNRRAQMIPAHRREAFKAAARAQGGFAPDSSFSAGNLAEGFSGAAGERAAVEPRMNIGDRFAGWRANAEGRGVAQQMPAATRTRDREDPAIQVLRNIEANTGKNKIAFAG